MKSVFADSNYWITLLSPKDNYHAVALKVSSQLAGSRVVTTNYVLQELLDGIAVRGPEAKRAGEALLQALRANPDIEIARLTEEQEARALTLLFKYKDKAWSLTDCMSFIVMEDMKIIDALTNNHHFIQAGYQALLRES